MNKELTPCPFCGSAPRLVTGLSFLYECSRCYASPGDRLTEEEAFELWEMRLPLAVQPLPKDQTTLF